MKIVIAADHAGYRLKNILLPEIMDKGFDVVDLGTNSDIPTDYPDHAASVAYAIIKGDAERGIIICGSGVGVSVAANKFKGIRAGVCHDHYSAHQCVEHDDVNVLCLGERVIGVEPAREIIMAFLTARFSKEVRHERRLKKIVAIENDNMK